MTGLRKTQKINCLIRLYERKGQKCDIKEIQTLSTTQLKKEIAKLRGQNTRVDQELAEEKIEKLKPLDFGQGIG